MCHDTLELQLMAGNERISVLVPPELKKEFEQLCKVERRSMSAQIVLLMEQALKEAKEQGKISDTLAEGK